MGPEGTAMTASVVDVLMLHNQTCSNCRVGEPCLVSERIQDEWLRRQAAKPEPKASLSWPAEHAA